MDEKKQPIEYTIHEDIVEWMQRANKRWFIICILLIVLLVGSLVGFFIYESQYEDIVITQDVDQSADGSGNNTYNGKLVGGDFYGEAEN